MKNRIFKATVMALAISSIPLGVCCVVLHFRIMDEVAARRIAFDSANASIEGVRIPEVCGLEYYHDASWADNSESEQTILVGCAFRRNVASFGDYFGSYGKYVGHWGMLARIDSVRIDASNFAPDSTEAYLKQVMLATPLRDEVSSFEVATRAEKVLMSLARAACERNDDWVIFDYAPVGEGAVLIIAHSYGMATLVLVPDEPGQVDRYRLIQTVGASMGVDPYPDRLRRSKGDPQLDAE